MFDSLWQFFNGSFSWTPWFLAVILGIVIIVLVIVALHVSPVPIFLYSFS